ncbi:MULTISPECIES: DUF4870 domain-containing protein [Spirosoma]|uniref:DUF4870 domain-containing protein n=1 Tax=Spirosoma liriopis TaxID=2937440 RepID=A0ABT0HFQ6_9BACT|nr:MULTISPECIES: DUF4870 domain-containing protein [Spirosoma]MCK8490983.1 DUF4870 domain-containing protein [Spirosoma liriopis]UHG90367.1 DUF4870 domain-containing protein [Spirosoma oryzicola]
MENRPPTPPLSPVPFSESDARLWAMLTHLSALPGSLVVIGSIVLPLVIWRIQKEKSAFVDFHGKEAVNFNITMALAAAISVILVFLLIGIFLIWLVGAVWLIFTLIAAIKANNGEYYRYPLTIRFIK